MNRKLLALAVGAAFALPMAAQAAPTIYGKLDVSVENLDGDQFDFVVPPRGTTKVDVTSMETNASRLGIRGEEKLTSNFSAIYQVEYGITVDGDSLNSSDLAARDRFLGLQNSQFGSLKLGRMDTPLKDAEGKVDLFNDSRLDMGNVFAGQNRVNNSIAYATPKIADAVTARVTLITEEQSSGSGVSASVAYEANGLYLAAAMDNNVDGDADAGLLNDGNSLYATYSLGPVPTLPLPAYELDTVRLVASYGNDTFQVGGLYQQSEVQGTGVQPEQTGLLVSGSFTMDKLTFKLQYGASESEQGPAKGGEITQLSAGVDYRWTQATKLYALVGTFEYDTPTQVFAGLKDADLSLFGVGMAHSF